MTTQESYLALLQKQEDLHPDLRSSIEQRKGSLTMLRHPLVFGIPYSPVMNAYLNAQYARKVTLLQEAKTKQDWGKVIILHERPYRLQALLELIPLVKGAPFWELVGFVWVDCEAPYINRKIWRELLTMAQSDPTGKALMNNGEQRALALMPPEVTIWRGASAPEKRPGISWTHDRERALFFARRFRRPGAFLWKLKCPKERVVAFFNDRNEHEVIVLDAKGAVKEDV